MEEDIRKLQTDQKKAQEKKKSPSFWGKVAGFFGFQHWARGKVVLAGEDYLDCKEKLVVKKCITRDELDG